MIEKPVILITGASSGIGEATAYRFAKGGYRVVLSARRQERLENISRTIIDSGGEALPIASDIGRWKDIQSLVATTLEKYHRIDVLFNNAGFGRLKWLDELDPVQDIEMQVQTNLVGLIQMSRAVLPEMMRKKAGHIINVASIAGLMGTPTYSVYAATKFGVRGFSEALRREVGLYRIRVSVIYPGGVDNEFKQKTGVNRKTGITTPSWLILTSEEVAERVWKLNQHPRNMDVMPGIFRWAVALNSVFPGFVDWIIKKRFVERERGLK